MARIWLYGRVSTDQQENSALNQRRQLMEFAMKSGLEMAGCCIDEDVSGGVPLRERPEGKRLCDGLERGDTVAFLKVDRVFRSLADAANQMGRWRNQGVRVAIIGLGIDVNSPAGELFFSQLAAFAQFERAMIGERIRDAIGHIRLSGRPYGPTRPLGWIRVGEGRDARYEPCLQERRLGARVVALRERGMTWDRIARLLRVDGVTKPGAGGGADDRRGTRYLESDCRRLYWATRANFPAVSRSEAVELGKAAMPPKVSSRQ